MSVHRLALGGLIVAVAVLLPAPAGAATIAGEELEAGASALVQGFCGDPGAGGSVTYSASGTLGGGSLSLGGSATVNGAGEITSFGGSFTVVSTADISPGTGTLSLGAPTAASGSCGPPRHTHERFLLRDADHAERPRDGQRPLRPHGDGFRITAAEA